MNVAGIPLLAFLALSFFATLVVKFSPSLFVFSLFNALIWAVILGTYRPPRDEVGGVWPSFQASHRQQEEGARDDVTKNDSDDDNGDYNGDCGSDGYDEDDDDDNGSNDDISWENIEDEEFDEDLDTRIEDFIAKVVRGWREERLKEKLQYG